MEHIQQSGFSARSEIAARGCDAIVAADANDLSYPEPADERIVAASHETLEPTSPFRYAASQPCVAWSRLRLVRLLCALLLLALAGLTSARAQASREYQLKAVFLYNFAQFTDWPTNAFASTNSPFVIGILGADPFGPALDNTVRSERAHGRPIVVERYRTVKEIKTCHILFISESETRYLDGILDALDHRPVLTVSDIDGAVFRGVMIRFRMENNKIRLRINMAAAKAAGLTFSSKLLRVADVVPREDER